MKEEILEFFGLNDNPFKITPDPNYYFLTKVHEEALYSLKYMYQTGEGFAVIIGEPGTGKTITIRKFIKELPDDVEFAYILFPNLSAEELLIAILEDLKINVPKYISKNKIFSIFRDFLIKKKQEGKRIFVIIDEAQNLPIETLEELRIISNLETEDEKLLQIILLGQPELEEKLNSPKLRQLKQRITIFSRLTPIDNEEEIKKYIEFRILKAGGNNISISNKAIKLIKKISNGNPRIINQLMERALMSAFIDETKNITENHIKNAARSLNLMKEEDELHLVFKIFAITLIIGLISISIGYIYLYKGSEDNVVKLNIESNPPTPIIYEKHESENLQDKYYIMYFAATPNLDAAIKLKKRYEEITKKNFYILKVKNGKLYAVALLYKDKNKAKKDLSKFKETIGKKDIFITSKKYAPEIFSN